MRDRRKSLPPAGTGVRKDSGFSLLEVLIALVILGLGLAVVMQGVAQGVAVRQASAEIQGLSLIVQDRLNDLMVRGEAPEGPEEGERGGLRWMIVPESGSDDEGEKTTVVLRIVAEAPSGRSLEVLTIMPLPEEER